MTPTRQEFLYFSLPEKLLFYFLILSSVTYMIWQFRDRVMLWKKGRPLASGSQSPRKWIGNVLVYVLGQKKVRSSRRKSGAPMHLAIFYGFMTLLLATTLLGVNTYSPIKFHKGVYFLAYEQISDWMGLVFVIGVCWAWIRRYSLSRRALSPLPPAGEVGELANRERGPSGPKMPGVHLTEGRQKTSNPITTTPNDYWTLALLLVLGVTGFWLEATRISVDPKPWDWTDPVGGALAHLQGDWSGLESKVLIYKSIWWFHAVLVGLFFAAIPKMRIRHILMAVGSVAGKPEEPMGRLRTISMEEVEQTEKVGASVADDFSRWHLMSLDACMECGRCTEVCPAWGVGKVLNPKYVVQDLKQALKEGAPAAEKISEEALWQCTTCNACVEACPVLIRHVDIIVDVRRNLVSEGKLTGPAATMLRQTASTSSAWGTPASSREDWMKGLDIPLCRDGARFDYLFWVGCAGATDPGAVKTTKAVAELLKKAGVSFACLGSEEACTGDPARRAGEEFLFQEKAAQNVSVFDRYDVKKVVTACPHCFNTLKNEYGEQGRQMEVFHHTQLLEELIGKGVLLEAKPQRGKVALHDPCYLTRINDEATAPRALAENLLEPVHAGKKTLCCGAGGGRMWMEEPPTQRPGNRRAKELIDTGADTVAVACPFCRIMLGDSLKHVEPEQEINLVDLAELVLAANQAK
ncbi:MAG TPA: (Fe-S)-binding protein [Fimbriimonas sp.]|nr:(Fe-S)-binding protein [Fimbriimonas sp.]